MHLVWKMTGFWLSSLMLSCHHHKFCNTATAAALKSASSRLFHVMSAWCMSVTLQYDLNKDFHRADENGGQSLDLLYATCQYFTVNLMGEIFDALFNFLRDLSKQKRHADFKTNFHPKLNKFWKGQKWGGAKKNSFLFINFQTFVKTICFSKVLFRVRYRVDKSQRPSLNRQCRLWR